MTVLHPFGSTGVFENLTRVLDAFLIKIPFITIFPHKRANGVPDITEQSEVLCLENNTECFFTRPHPLDSGSILAVILSKNIDCYFKYFKMIQILEMA